jgi:hypothetical protein
MSSLSTDDGRYVSAREGAAINIDAAFVKCDSTSSSSDVFRREFNTPLMAEHLLN